MRFPVRVSRSHAAGILSFAFAALLLDAATSGALAYSPPKAALIIDANSGRVLHASNAHEPRYPASLTKVMTFYILFEYLRDGRLSMDTRLTVSAQAASRPPSKVGFKPGDTISVRDAISLLMTKSANDVAAAVAENIAGSEAAFARLMTRKARAIGMKKTTFRNASGLPDVAQKTTAHDMAILARRILSDFPERAGEFQRKHASFRGKSFRNHNRLLFTYQGALGMKTGFIRASGFNVMIAAQRGQKRLYGVVMGGRSGADRDALARRLLDAAWSKASVGAPRMAGNLPGRNPAFKPSPTEVEIRSRLARASAQPSEILLRGEAGPLTRDAMPRHRPLRKSEARLASSTLTEAQPATDPMPEARGSAEAGRLAGPYHVQVGAYVSAADALRRLQTVSAEASALLASHPHQALQAEVGGREVFRARFGGFREGQARQTCAQLKRRAVECLVTAAN